MGRLIHPDGIEETVRPAKKRFSLEELQSFVGGYIELVKTRKPVRNMYINENGLLDDLPVNPTATILIDPAAYWITPPGVRGSVIVCDKGEG